MEWREESEGQSHKEEDREGQTGTGEGPRDPQLGRALLGYMCRVRVRIRVRVRERQLTLTLTRLASDATADEAGLPT